MISLDYQESCICLTDTWPVDCGQSAITLATGHPHERALHPRITMTEPASLYGELIAAFNRRDWRRILQVATRLIPLAPRHPGVFYVTGVANLELEQIEPALHCLRRARELEPANALYAAQLAKALSLGHMNRDAKVAADEAFALIPKDPLVLDTLGVIYSKIGAYDMAVKTFRRVTKLAPEHAPSHYNLSTSLVAAGDLGAAEAALEECLSLDPRYWRAHLSLSQLRRQTPQSNHVQQLKSLVAATENENKVEPVEASARVCLHMALFKEYEDLGNYVEAFDHLVIGKKAAGGSHRDYSIEQDERLFAAITESFSEPVENKEPGCATAEPIFVIGMPRTGTTLVERILSSHPQVQSAGELLNFAMALKQLSGSRTSGLINVDTIVAARRILPPQLGEMYLSSTRPATGTHPHFIDKLPHNFQYAGFIARALPNAKIVCLRRDPMDTCLSNFRQLFAKKSPYFDYSFDLLDIGRYYVLFDRLMAHWQRVFPGRILEVQYESLVEFQEEYSRRMIEFCGLPWDDTCMAFEKNPAPVATASAVQVRAPMYRNALKRWKKYGPKMDALHDLLSRAGVPLH